MNFSNRVLPPCIPHRDKRTLALGDLYASCRLFNVHHRCCRGIVLPSEILPHRDTPVGQGAVGALVKTALIYGERLLSPSGLGEKVTKILIAAHAFFGPLRDRQTEEPLPPDGFTYGEEQRKQAIAF